MSNSAANAAAKRRRGATQQPMGQSQIQQQQQIAPPPTLSVPQSIYLLSNRITHLESQLQHAINSNNIGSVNDNNSTDNVIINQAVQQSTESTINSDDFIVKSDFNDVMTSIGSDMNGLSQKMNTLNEFVVSVQNSYLGLNKAILDLQQKTDAINVVENNSLNVSENVSVLSNEELEDNVSNDNGSIVEELDEVPAQVVSADITSRLKMLSVKSDESNNTNVNDEGEVGTE